MYKRKFDTSDVYENKKVKIETRICNCNKCKGKEIPLNQNNFFIVDGDYEDLCSRCSEYKRCGLCMEVKTKDNFSIGKNICKQCTNIEAYERKNGQLPSLRFYCPGCDKYKLKHHFLFIDDIQENVCYLCSEYKSCSCCRHIKYRSEFNNCIFRFDGYDNFCKYCKSITTNKYYNRPEMICLECAYLKSEDLEDP